MAGNLGLESSSPFVRLAQPIETKWGIWLRGVDLFPSRSLIPCNLMILR